MAVDKGLTPTLVRLPNSDLRALRKIAKLNDRPVAWLIRAAVSDYLDRQMGGAA